MSANSLLDVASSIASILSPLVFGVGYYLMIRLYRTWVHQTIETREAGGRPLVVVVADYSHLPRVNLVVVNFNKAPAKEVRFDFSAPVEDSSGFVLSDLPYLKEGLPFLEPEGKISRYWDALPDLAPMLREKGLEGGVKVTTRYKDLAGESYETEWTLNPLLFEGSGIENSKGMNDLVGAVEEISGNVPENGSRRTSKDDESREARR